jgi:CMP-N-acetylneuraminic acid synthetase/spore coat polysaccharide biosynthesis predicted glycosyltransferase SpsG
MVDTDGVLVAVIPARAGSKGIPLKNIREIGFSPLIIHTINAAKNAKLIDKVIMTTDSIEISNIAKAAGAEVPFIRPADIADDNTTLAAVVKHFIEWSKEKKWDIEAIVILQPTSPLRSASQIDEAIELFRLHNADTVISVERSSSLEWIIDEEKPIPVQAARLNRQELPPRFKENGAIFVTRPDVVTNETTIGEKVALYEMDHESSIDINTYWEMWLAELLLRRMKILFHFKATEILGFGHFYRILALANRLYYHNVIFLCSEFDTLAKKKISTTGFRYFFDDDPISIIEKEKPVILVNDILDTSDEYMQRIRDSVPIIVNFEDLGLGNKKADLVFNALYDDFSLNSSHYGGGKFAIMREEFMLLPKRIFHDKVKLVTATFGGSDPNNMAIHCVRTLPGHFPDIKFRIIMGPGYGHNKEPLYKELESHSNLELIDVSTNMEKHLSEADIAIISGGRTVFEAAACGTPAIVICQNERELQHRHISSRDGIINLGLFDEKTSMSELLKNLEQLIESPELRIEMSERISSVVDGLGIFRVIALIEKVALTKGYHIVL